MAHDEYDHLRESADAERASRPAPRRYGTRAQRAVRDAEWVRWYAAGMTIDEIARVAGVSSNPVRNAVLRAGVAPRARGPRPGRLRPNTPRNLERQVEVVGLRRKGLSLAQIGVRLGITRERVRQIVARAEKEAQA